MNCDYQDIREKIKEKPLWFDENAVPRYCEFSPRKIANIYAKECALILIACQSCHTEFKVVLSHDVMDEVRWKVMYNEEMLTIADRIKRKIIHYGDPPNIGCCGAGPTMNCEDFKVLEYWEGSNFDRLRKPELEISLLDNFK